VTLFYRSLDTINKSLYTTKVNGSHLCVKHLEKCRSRTYTGVATITTVKTLVEMECVFVYWIENSILLVADDCSDHLRRSLLAQYFEN
jgi:hypothetical protein